MFSISETAKLLSTTMGGMLMFGYGMLSSGEQVTGGHTVTLTASADGTPPFAYKWQRNGVLIGGATAEKYVVRSMQESDAGDYIVTVSNSAGSVISPAATLALHVPVTLPPAPSPPLSTTSAATSFITSQVATEGHDVTLTTATTSTGGWQVASNGSSVWSDLTESGHYSGTSSNNLVISNITSSLNGYSYRFVTSSGAGDPIKLSVASAFFPFPIGISIDGAGNLYVTDTSTDTVQKISAAGAVTLLAGAIGQIGTSDGSGFSARFNDPSGISSAKDGTLSVSDNANGTLRRVSTSGVVTTLAGSTGRRGNDDGRGTAATLSSPLGIAQDASGNLYIADSLNNTIRKVGTDGMVSTLAGAVGVGGSADGVGSNARFNHPTGITVDSAGNVYVADTMNNTVRRITSTANVTTLAGVAGVSGMQDGVGAEALFNNPAGLAADSAGNIYVVDAGNSTIRKISPNGSVLTFAGLPGIAGLRDGNGTDAWFNQPKGIAVDSAGYLYVADTGNAVIRKITSIGGVTTLALTAGAPINNAASDSSTNNQPPVSGIAITPAPTASPQVASTGGGGGGGGSTEGWFVLFLLMIAGIRWRSGIFRTLRHY